MPSFDIVSEVDQVEVHNAVDQANKEIGSRLVVSAEATQAADIRDCAPFSELPVRGRRLPVRLCRLA